MDVSWSQLLRLGYFFDLIGTLIALLDAKSWRLRPLKQDTVPDESLSLSVSTPSAAKGGWGFV